MKLERSSDQKAASGAGRRRGPHISLDRRVHPRRPAVDYRVWVGGWVSGSEFATVAARVEDISLGGARVLTPLPFTIGDDVWLKLGSVSSNECVRAQVLDASMTRDGEHVSRLRFHSECPETFYEVVTEGLRG